MPMAEMGNRWPQPMRYPDTGDSHGVPPEHERGIDPSETALKIIKKNPPADVIVKTISNFTGLDRRVADELMASDLRPGYMIIVEHISHFKPEDHNAIALKLLSSQDRTPIWRAEHICENLASFRGLGHEALQGLIDQGQPEMVAMNLSPQTFDLSDPLISTLAEKLVTSLFANAIGQVDSPDGYIHKVKTLQKIFGLPEETVTAIAQKAVQHWLSFQNTSIAGEIQEIFKPPLTPATKATVEPILLYIISNRRSTGSVVFQIAKTFELPDAAVAAAAEKALADNISSGSLENAEIIHEEFLPKEDLGSLILKHRQDIRTLFRDLNLVSNEQLVKQLCTYPADGVSMRTMQTVVQDNVFLGRALAQNPKYGVKLLLKYPKLDELSQNNIRLLYEVKRSYKGDDTDAVKFRMAVQQRLIGKVTPELDDQALAALRERHKGFVNLEDVKRSLGYGKGQGYINNQTILAAIEAGGVDVDTWLNHPDEREFNLGKEEEVSLSEKISVPFNRFIASIDRHDEGFKSVMDEYKNALRGKRVALNQTALVEEIGRLRAEKEKPGYAGDDPEEKLKAKRKAEGIPRRLAQLEAQLTAPQTVSLWDKFVGDLSVIQQNMKALLKMHLNMQNTEEELKKLSDRSLTPPERRKKMAAFKDTLNSLERDLADGVVQLGSRLTTYDRANMELFSTQLGQEFGSTFERDFLRRVSADMDHLGADAESIKRLIQIENENISLAGTSMRIGVWNRDPDVDLYLGNETNCCIRIDSEHMGEESTIADYLTDVGMQVVKIIDEKRDSTIIAAWCLIGKNRATGEVALVVDNIEANTDYSLQFNTQLSRQLRAYLETYARKSGLTKIVQGELNNDLELFSMDGEYDKLGGYNREDGYYLEGEGDDEEEG